MTYALINGARIPEEQAAVSIHDRSFRFGDGLFETIGVHEGLPYLWEYHIERLAGGLEALRIGLDVKSLLPQALELLQANGTGRGLLRIQVSRGAGGRGYLPDSGIAPTVVLQTLPPPKPPQAPVALWLSALEKISPRCLPTRFKLAQGLSSTLARIEAAENGCFDALQPGENGCLCEAGSANLFWRKGGALYTPSLECGALAGIMRRRVMELAPYPVNEGRFHLADMAQADAVMLTNAALGAIAVGRLAPNEMAWDSAALALQVNSLIDNDITHNTRRLRELLAQT